MELSLSILVMQSAEHILLVKPSRFLFNTETAGSNTFQQDMSGDAGAFSATAIREFEVFEETLRSAGVNVIVFEDTAQPQKPDALFPNNWVSFHHDGRVLLYPMFAPNRRAERRPDIIQKLKEHFYVKEIIDLSSHEQEGKFLEGTGSIVFDHINRLAYACISPRTNKELFLKVCGLLDYKPFYFHAGDRGGMAIYHTNVMMCVAEKFALVCLESIAEPGEKKLTSEALAESGHTIIDISIPQMNHFAGNMLAVKNKQDRDVLVMSQSAWDVLTGKQRDLIGRFCSPLPIPVKTIESIGGGSARCMMAEVFLPLKKKNANEIKT
jgi:hypothetical protein